MKTAVLCLIVAAGVNPASAKDAQTAKPSSSLIASHIHVGVRDLKGAVDWLGKVWQLFPTFQNDRMASVPFGPLTLILDSSPQDSRATIGFDSKNCDRDYRAVIEREAVSLEACSNKPWGVRAAYVQGPGELKFEIEQALPRK